MFFCTFRLPLLCKTIWWYNRKFVKLLGLLLIRCVFTKKTESEGQKFVKTGTVKNRGFPEHCAMGFVNGGCQQSLYQQSLSTEFCQPILLSTNFVNSFFNIFCQLNLSTEFAIPIFRQLNFLNNCCQWSLSMEFVNGVCQQSLSTEFVNGVCQYSLSTEFVNRLC